MRRTVARTLAGILGGSLIWISAAWAISAQPFSVKEIQEKMLESDKRLSALKIEYSQTMSSSLSAEVKESSGRAYFKKPGEFRIEQSDPEKQIIVSSGKSVYIYTPRFKQVVKDSWRKWSESNFLFPGFSGFGQTLARLKNDYLWSVRGSAEINGENMILVHLSKADGKSEGENIVLWLSESDFIPRKTELVMGTLKMTTQVTSLEANPELDPKIFKFDRPKDAEIIQVP